MPTISVNVDVPLLARIEERVTPSLNRSKLVSQLLQKGFAFEELMKEK